MDAKRKLGLACTLFAIGAGSALARPPGMPGMGGRMGPDGAGGEDSPMRREMQRENRLRWIADRDEQAPQGPPRLSPEERRELRRDVHDAGRELYRPHRRGRRDGPEQ